MSVVLRLDRPAVAALIADDPEFKYELQRTVVSEVIRKFIDKDTLKIITAAQPELMKQALDAAAISEEFQTRVEKALNARIAVKPPGYAFTFKLTPDFQKMVDSAVETELTKIKAAIEAAITERAQELVDKRLADEDIDERIAKRVDRLLDAELERRVLEHRDRLLDKVKKALG